MEALIKPIVFSNGLQMIFNKNDNGDGFVLSLSSGPLTDLLISINQPSINIEATQIDLVKLQRAISASAQVFQL